MKNTWMYAAIGLGAYGAYWYYETYLVAPTPAPAPTARVVAPVVRQLAAAQPGTAPATLNPANGVPTTAPTSAPVSNKTYPSYGGPRPGGYVLLSNQAAALNLTGTVSNGGYGVGLTRGWVGLNSAGSVVQLPATGAAAYFATPDVAAALEAAS